MSDIRFRLIDASNIDDHSRLEANDKCYFLFEYTARQHYTFSDTNGLVSNLKKKPTQYRGTSAWKYKGQAIQRCSRQMRQAMNGDWLTHATLVPIPPSKIEGHPDYDDRVEQICRGLGSNVDVRLLVQQTESMAAAHEAGTNPRPTVGELIHAYEINETQAKPTPTSIGIVDDVLTAGTHFKAVQHVLWQRFPGVPVYGFFVARRIFAVEESFPDFDF